MKSRALVFRRSPYSDDKMIVSLFTEQAGLVDMMVRRSASKRARVRSNVFQPLTMLEVEWNEHSQSALKVPQQAAVVMTYPSVLGDYHKLMIGLFVLEFLCHAVRNEPASEALFHYIAGSIEWLDTCERDFANFHLVFLLRLTRFLGFMPSAEGYAEGAYFDLRAGAFTSAPPLHSDFLAPGDASLVPLLLRMKYANMRLFRLTGRNRSRLLEQIVQYYRLHLPGFPELQTLKVLQQLV